MQSHGIDHLVIPTRDYLFAPSYGDIHQAVEFIHSKCSQIVCWDQFCNHCSAVDVILFYLLLPSFFYELAFKSF